MSGSPSPWNVFAMMAKEARVRERRVYVSVLVSAEDEVGVDMVVDGRKTILDVGRNIKLSSIARN